MTILVPTDFSENSNNAVEYAAEMSSVTISKIVLLHVLNPHTDAGYLAECEKRLGIIKETLASEYPNVQCSRRMITGEIVESILLVAKEENAGLIIMETEGATNFTRTFLGSKTAMVIEQTDCPVLSLPSNYGFRKPARMIFCTNFAHEDIKGAVQFVLIAKRFNAEVIVTHVSVNPDRRHTEASRVEEFSREVADLTDYAKVRYVAMEDNTVTMGLDQLIHDTSADMIALSTRRRGVLERFYNPSITKKLSMHNNIPLLAFHIQEE
jgi:nucleotide-binding universal stress UspA family protein